VKILDPEQQLGYLVVRVADQISRPWFAALQEHGVNPRQFSILSILVQDPELSQAELARRVMITPQSMSESIGRLLSLGLLRRDEVVPGHAARLSVTLTGKALLRRAYPVVEATNRESFSALSGRERDQLGDLLRKLLA
jgi:DNA-binding MarR family transcriptional regulator